MDRRMRAPDVPLDIFQVVAENGYTEMREVEGHGWCGLLQFAFTWAIVVNLTPDCYERRYCYEHQVDAIRALTAWNGLKHPSGPWIKCKGVGVDFLNPALALI